MSWVWWIGVGMVAMVILYIVGYINIKSVRYLLNLQEKCDTVKLQKKMIEVHYKYARQCYEGLPEMWEKHKKVCLYGCDKR